MSQWGVDCVAGKQIKLGLRTSMSDREIYTIKTDGFRTAIPEERQCRCRREGLARPKGHLDVESIASLRAEK